MNYTRRSKAKTLEIFRWLKERGFAFTEERSKDKDNFRWVAAIAYINGQWHLTSYCLEDGEWQESKLTLTWESVFRHVERKWRES